MKIKNVIVFWVFLLFAIHIQAQNYIPVVKPDTLVWYFSHSQLSGTMIDTLYAENIVDNTIEIWYKGNFYNWEKTFAGIVRSSLNNDKLWYLPNGETTEYLIYDLALEKGDEFDFITSNYSGKVDSVYLLNGLRVVEFEASTNWNEPIRFIEGVGPNITIIWAWKDPGFLNPFVVCAFENYEKIYETKSENFMDCRLNTSLVPHLKISKFQILPNPCNDHVWIKYNGHYPEDKIQISVYTMRGLNISIENVSMGENFCLSMTGCSSGVYFITIRDSNDIKTYKIIKL